MLPFVNAAFNSLERVKVFPGLSTCIPGEGTITGAGDGSGVNFASFQYFPKDCAKSIQELSNSFDCFFFKEFNSKHLSILFFKSV